MRIKEQRNHISRFLSKYSPEDFLIYSDNDEIPDLKNFDFQKIKKDVVIFKQKIFYYKFNLILPGIDWFGSKACKIKNLKTVDILRNSKNKKYAFYRIDALFSDIKHQSLQVVQNGGWHFSNLKTHEDLHKKYLNDENHSEYEALNLPIERVRQNIENWTIDYDHLAKKESQKKFKTVKLERIELDVLPKFIQDNRQKYIEWIIK